MGNMAMNLKALGGISDKGKVKIASLRRSKKLLVNQEIGVLVLFLLLHFKEIIIIKR